MSRKPDRLGIAFTRYIQFIPDAIKIIDRFGMTATYIPIDDDLERHRQTSSASCQQSTEIANAIVWALPDELL